MEHLEMSAATIFRPQLLERRKRLEAARGTAPEGHLKTLLDEVDAALRRIEEGTYGLCETCHDPIEQDRLLADPLVRFCVDHLTAEQARAHEEDLAMAARIQAQMLPAAEFSVPGWETHYHYQAAGAVGGDYCDLMTLGEKSFFFAVGDVSGKGVAASLLMTHLSAILRSLLSVSLPLPEVMARANRLFCESTSASHYATLVCGSVSDGAVEITNAGHCRPLLARGCAVERLEVSGLPLGMFCHGEYAVEQAALASGDRLVLYSDGVTEAHDPEGSEYGEERLMEVVSRGGAGARECAEAILRDHAVFRKGAPLRDDFTLLVVRRRE
jgi:sigma-B regulation protein RsbU (phosphoserine phosphatase)